jgi:hypothetical protein
MTVPDIRIQVLNVSRSRSIGLLARLCSTQGVDSLPILLGCNDSSRPLG